MEIGNNKENLTLKTAGKLKVQWGNKFIDLLDNNGNLKIKHQQIIKTADDSESITSDGIYIVDDEKVIIRFGETLITLSSESETQESLNSSNQEIESLKAEIDELKSSFEEEIESLKAEIDELKNGTQIDESDSSSEDT